MSRTGFIKLIITRIDSITLNDVHPAFKTVLLNSFSSMTEGKCRPD